MGGVCTQLDLQTSNVSTFPTYPLSFHAIPHSFPKTTRGGVSPILLELPSRARRPTHGTATIFHQSLAQPASTWSGPCFFSTFNCQPLCVRSCQRKVEMSGFLPY